MKHSLKKRITSAITAIVMVSAMLPLEGFQEIQLPGLPKISIPHFAMPAITATADDSYIADASGWVPITTAASFLTYCSNYQSDAVFAAAHENDRINLVLDGDSNDVRGIMSSDLVGLGTEAHPFAGSIKLPDNGNVGGFTLSMNGPLFSYVKDSVKIVSNGSRVVDGITEIDFETLAVFKRLDNVESGTSKPLFAQHVVHDTTTGAVPANWQVRLSNNNVYTYSGVIGEIGSSATVKLSFDNASNGSNVASKAAVNDSVYVEDAGIICGRMQAGSTLELNYSETAGAYTISSDNGNAGGLVGTMLGNASLTIASMPSTSRNVNAASGYAGGLIGELSSENTITVSSGSAIAVNSGSVNAANGAGGFCGHYTNTKSAGAFDLADYQINTTAVYGQYCGGIFGVLENNKDTATAGISYTIQNTNATGSLSAASGTETTYATNGYFGGMIGQYKTDDLKNSLILDGLSVGATAQAAFAGFGGAIGIVDSATYVKTTNTVTVDAEGTALTTYFGGLIGATSSAKGVFVDLGNFTLDANSEAFQGGGVVGQFNNGVLRLAGTTNMTAAKPADADNCGQLVGFNNNVLVYALGNGNDSNWTYNRYNGGSDVKGALADDLGTWGEVVRLGSIESTLLTLDTTEHTVTVASAAASMGTPTDFAKTAVNIQLNQGSNYDCLKFTPGNANKRSELLGSSSSLSISADIDLSGIGITGFMRDGGTVTDIGSFAGTFEGNAHKITLAVGQTYGVGASGQTEGMGQIYRHQHNGLFSVLSGKVQNLEVTGTINVRNRVDGMNIGGVASRNGGGVTLTGITASETINYHESTNVTGSEAGGKNIGGMIGFVGSNGTITINGVSSVTAAINFSGHHQNWNACGGAIGKVTASNFEINVGTTGNSSHKLTIGMDEGISGVTNVGDDSNSGGLIGYITAGGSYANRKININNLEISSCTIGNASKKNGGGFLGYLWLNTATTVNGLTVSSGTINNSITAGTAGNVGAVCYGATGKWIVNSLQVNGMTMPDGCGTSLGMIVNKAYHTSGSTTNGLYLDVLNAGYSLKESGISLPSNLGVYDEIAAYSASDVVAGGGGVVSVNMNAARAVTNSTDNKEAKITVTGTYQDQLTSSSSSALGSGKYANPNTRYYYNLDVMDPTDGGQNLVLWSVNKYAASNIKGEFVAASDPLGSTSGTTNADLTGLSFYPIESANANYTIGNLALTFDYDGLYATAENTFGTANLTDSYNRDPGAANQHYLMHSGLFINQPFGNTLTVSGNLSLAGTFLEDSTHSGVIFSGTMRGNLECEDNSEIKLDGIKPKTTGNVDYSNGYLLINTIERDTDLSANAPIVNIQNVYTTNSYSTATYTANTTNDVVAKSLIGAASGKDLHVVFAKIKLDARSLTNGSVKSDVNLEALYDAYGTYNSIFKSSTLLASLYADKDAVLEYNYSCDHDWGSGSRNVTYGKEVKTSVEWNDGTNSLERKYYDDDRHFTNPISDSNTEYDFSTGFLKYVAHVYDSTKDAEGLYYRELKVNVMTEGLTVGCGTYNDPYIITDGVVLGNVAAFIKSGTGSVMPKICLPKTAENYDTLAENTTGKRWCDQKSDHAIFKPNNEQNVTAYISDELDDCEWTPINVRYYLCNAYYKIGTDIVLGDSFSGLGGSETSGQEANLAFRGVIIGDTNQDGTLKYTITNMSEQPFINVSNGSVIKDLNIVVANESIELTQANNTNANAYFGYVSACKYYGGIIGEIMGGDNIIDNSYVSFQYTENVEVEREVDVEDPETHVITQQMQTQIEQQTKQSTITLKGTSGTIIPVGGYVGVIVYGGLIFKNMTAANTAVTDTHLKVTSGDSTTNLANDAGLAAIYVNPIVGRVINGYAVNETQTDAEKHTTGRFSTAEVSGQYRDGTARANTTEHSLKNGRKHYTIADINKSETEMLNVTATATSSKVGTINVPNAQALFILSLITQSCAGTARTADGEYINSLSYGTNTTVYGMSHDASYDFVGTELDVNDENNAEALEDYLAYASYDTAANTAVPYIIRSYTMGGERPVTYPAKLNKIELSKDELDGKLLYISVTKDGNSPTYCLSDTTQNDGAKLGLQATTDVSKATLVKLELQEDGTYTISNADGKYLGFHTTNNRNFTLGNSPCYLTIDSNKGQWLIYVSSYTNNDKYLGLRNSKHFIGQAKGTYETLLDFNEKVDAHTEIALVYPARCVTSTLGYYDINLTGSGTYKLPDSFRGLGSVGIYDTVTDITNPYSIKLNTFDGKNCTIDADIYLNKFKSDNYFNVLHPGTSQTLSGDSTVYAIDTSTDEHGIGLFDSVILKSGGKFYNFTLKGRVRTELYESGAEFTGIPTNNNAMIWHSTGGVLGWSRGTQAVNFEKIKLNDLSVYGSNYVAGLLAHSGNNTTSLSVTIQECSADNISLTMAASQHNSNPRNAMGAFVGKVKQGKVIVYGTSETDHNTDLTKVSKVKIKSFSFGNKTDNFYVSVGGLVGYSGHGFSAYDMKVEAKDSGGTTLGNAKTGICGGIVGVMQPAAENNEEGKALFKNCITDNINIQGNYAGGIYGGKWGGTNWVPYRIELDNCKVIGTTEKNSIIGGEYAGGLVGYGYIFTRNNQDANVIISDCKVSNYNIYANTGKYSGGFVGYCDSRQQSITCYIHDSSVETCVIGQSGDVDYAGGAIGGIERKDDNKILGYNIKLDNVSSDSNRMGAWIGYAASDTDTQKTSIQFAGMAIYGDGFTKNVGNDAVLNTASFVYADYKWACKGVTSNGQTVYPDDVSTFNDDDNVDMPKYPYVNINPQISMGTGEFLSGDGAVLNSTSTGSGTGAKTMAAYIYAQLDNNLIGRRYTIFRQFNGTDAAKISGNNKIDYYLTRTAGTDGDRISTFGTENEGGLPAGLSDDFAVVVIANNDPVETTYLINRYIQLVTNTSTNYFGISDYYTLDEKTCKFVGTKFVITSDEPGLKKEALHENTEDTSEVTGYTYVLDGTHADSLRENTFTLVDVQFKDPFDTDQIAYHLYVPVYTRKQMNYDFYASALTDTKSVYYPHQGASAYEAAFGQSHVDSLKTWVTHYVRFSYEESDMNALLEAGNVNWHHNKYVLLNTQQASERLPIGTKMILVDPNGLTDQTYYASINTAGFVTETTDGRDGWRIDLNKFTRDGTANGTTFTANDFSKVLARHIVATTPQDGGPYRDVTDSVKADPATPYTIYDSVMDKYYLYVMDGTGTYSLAVDGDINEDYYISTYVPVPDAYTNELYYYTVQSPAKLEGQKTAAVDTTTSCNVLIAQLFAQEDMTYNVSPSHEQINTVDPVITVTAEATVRLTNHTAASYLSSVSLYHAFHVLLNRYEPDGSVNNEIIGLDKEEVTGNYSLNGGTAVNFVIDENEPDNDNIDLQSGHLDARTTNLMNAILASNNNSVRVKANISMAFHDLEEFPEKTIEGNIGVNVATSSNLAYEKERLSYTSMSTAFLPDGKYYHREAATAAHLSYVAIPELDRYDTYGKDCKNFSRLGVNGYSSVGKYTENNVTRTAMQIHSRAVFNASAVEESYFRQADTVRFTMRLWKKTDIVTNNTVTAAQYQQVNISDYLLGVELQNKKVLETTKPELIKNDNESDAQTYVYDLTIAGCEELGPRIYPVYFVYYAITGDGFYDYANYQVEIQAELLDSTTGKTVGNQPKDWIVYTNAKVYPTVIDENTLAAANASSP